MTDEAWIEQSLARLETLEAQKAQHEAAGQAVPAQLDEEIVTLYEALEAAAEDEGAAPPAEAPAVAAAAPVAAAPVAAPAAGLPDDPFAAPAAPPVQAPAPMAAAQAAPAVAPVAMDNYDDDFKPSGGKGGMIAIAALLVLGVGAGGYWYVSQNKAAPPPAEPEGETKVISASSVPDDTQEPQAAKGADASRTQGSDFKEGPAPRKPSGKRNGGGGGNRRRNNAKKDDGRKVTVSDDRDPLSGI